MFAVRTNSESFFSQLSNSRSPTGIQQTKTMTTLKNNRSNQLQQQTGINSTPTFEQKPSLPQSKILSKNYRKLAENCRNAHSQSNALSN